MARPRPSNRPQPPRSRVRELLTFAAALAIAFVLGRLIIQVLHRPAPTVQIVLFVILYVLAFVALHIAGTRLSR